MLTGALTIIKDMPVQGGCLEQFVTTSSMVLMRGGHMHDVIVRILNSAPKRELWYPNALLLVSPSYPSFGGPMTSHVCCPAACTGLSSSWGPPQPRRPLCRLTAGVIFYGSSAMSVATTVFLPRYRCQTGLKPSGCSTSCVRKFLAVRGNSRYMCGAFGFSGVGIILW